VTVVATQQMRHRALEAAQLLTREGIETEVIDPRTLVPFDDQAVAESLAKTARLLVVQEGPPGGGWGASLIARMTSDHFDCFDVAPKLLASAETPVPYAAALEQAWMPRCQDVVEAARELVTA
jgi:pyruvate dehydrogenase E1 component beta subunit